MIAVLAAAGLCLLLFLILVRRARTPRHAGHAPSIAAGPPPAAPSRTAPAQPAAPKSYAAVAAEFARSMPARAAPETPRAQRIDYSGERVNVAANGSYTAIAVAAARGQP
jgi:uncharacterized iron-regulated membrane protein